MCFLRSSFIRKSLGTGSYVDHSAHSNNGTELSTQILPPVTLGRIRRQPPKPGVTSTSGFFCSRRDVFPDHGSVAETRPTCGRCPAAD